MNLIVTSCILIGLYFVEPHTFGNRIVDQTLLSIAIFYLVAAVLCFATLYSDFNYQYFNAMFWTVQAILISSVNIAIHYFRQRRIVKVCMNM